MSAFQSLWPLWHPLNAGVTAKMWVGNRVSTAKHVFIVGAPRSGTTLLKTLLVANSSLAGSLYESTGLFRYRDMTRFRVSGLDDSWITDRLRSQHSVVDLFDSVASRFVEIQNAERFLDKLTIKRWRLLFVRKHFPGSKFVNIVRDGRDCFCSALRHPNVRQSDTLNKFAQYWTYCVKTVPEIIPEDSSLTVRYEDLTSEPESTVRNVMNWLGIDFESHQIDPEVYKPQISKREVHKNLATSVNTSSHQRWRKEMSVDQVRKFDQIAAESLSACGYINES